MEDFNNWDTLIVNGEAPELIELRSPHIIWEDNRSGFGLNDNSLVATKSFVTEEHGIAVYLAVAYRGSKSEADFTQESVYDHRRAEWLNLLRVREEKLEEIEDEDGHHIQLELFS